MISIRKLISYLALLCLLVSPGMVGSSSSVTGFSDAKYDEKYEPLVKFLEEAGYSREITRFLFLDERVQYHPNLVLTKVPEKENSFDNITQDFDIIKFQTREFLQTYREDLEKAERRYDVDKEAIAAIIYVETKFGHYTGSHRIFNVLTSLALADQEFALQELRREIQEKYADKTSMKIQNLISYYERYARKKALMAKFELAHLVEMYINQNYNIMELRGSFAGAFGYCQFMPSSFNNYAVDGDGDNRIDLFNYHDAIFSIANYLNEKGWSDSYYAKRRALLRYNYSRKYVADVFGFSSKIRTLARDI